MSLLAAQSSTSPNNNNNNNNNNMNTPLLGTEWLEAQLVTASVSDPETQPQPHQPAMPTLPPQSVCLDLSEFRRLLTRYRKLDDSINLSLNRSFSILNSSSPQQAPTTQCAEFWKILTDSWSSREKLIRSCIDLVHSHNQQQAQPDKAQLYTAELRQRMTHDELAVESAIRNQAFQKFRSRCSPSIFHIPPHNSPTLNLVSQPPSSSQ